MSWKDIDKAGQETEVSKKRQKEIEAEKAELSKKFYRVFSTDEGKLVLDHLFRHFVLDNDTPLEATNITYEAGFHAGEACAIKYITNQMSKATTSNEYD